MDAVVADIPAALQDDRLELLNSRGPVISLPVHVGGPLGLRQGPIGAGEQIELGKVDELATDLVALVDRPDEPIRAPRRSFDTYASLDQGPRGALQSQVLRSGTVKALGVCGEWYSPKARFFDHPGAERRSANVPSANGPVPDIPTQEPVVANVPTSKAVVGYIVAPDARNGERRSAKSYKECQRSSDVSV